jgi:acetyl-CoA carboxylase biotin carboxylase subunit
MAVNLFSKILIANRAEIAVRIIRACRELGIATVAVYSEADRNSLHVQLADEAVCIGPAPASESYLSIDRILEAVRTSGADAVHPGYGFLSENSQFTRAVLDSGATFIGPSPEAVELMGDKGRARETMMAHGVPVVPGYQGRDLEETLVREGERIGYPLLVKAAAGGGGKGMRVVQQPGDLKESIAAARREAVHAFNDPRLILERYITNARHIEFQVLFDEYGNGLHLFERECSLQRRHQKVIEETPSPFLDEELRQQMSAAALSAARAVDYRNAGTVEFIVDPRTREFYFLEMNTRLQVEHPITEWVTGLDLVQWQIRIAAGEPLLYRQEDIRQRGHAIECRLYAEDPANEFLPTTGPLLRFQPPEAPGIRIDTGFRSGAEISIHYDPLIAKLIVWAEDRPLAIRRMATALRQTVLLGVTNNVQFLQDLIATPEFLRGDYSTTWIEDTFADWSPPECDLPPEVVLAAALSAAQMGSEGTVSVRESNTTADRRRDPFNPWIVTHGFRLGE